MAYNNNEPADDSKVRDFPSLTRANFQGISAGNTTFFQSQVNVKVGASPTEVTDFFQLYSQDVSGETSLKGLSYDGTGGNTIIFSESGYLGANTQSLALQDLSFDISDSKYTLDGNFICHAYGQFSSDGTLNPSRSKNISGFSGPSSAIYTITTEAIYANANVVVVATCEGVTDRFVTLHATPTITAGALTILLKTRNSGGTTENAACNFMILGGM